MAFEIEESKMTTTSNLQTRLADWIKSPSTWISLAALLISVITFYLVYLDAGTMVIYPAEQVAIQIRPDSSFILTVPTVLYNTASSGKWKTIKDITVTARIRDRDGTPHTTRLGWVSTSRFMSKLDFEKNYPTEAQADVVEYFVYESKKVPFSISGKQTTFKLLNFTSRPIADLAAPFLMDIVVETITMEGENYRSPAVSYSIPERDFQISQQSGVFRWISQRPDQ
jgi:hypothetical protein